MEMQWIFQGLFVLICPIIMLFMMKGMHGRHNNGTGSHHGNHDGGNDLKKE
jgi:hypothetical protein